MFRLACVACLLIGCRVSLESERTGDDDDGGKCQISNSEACVQSEADAHADLAWIETKIFAGSCVFSGCHNGDSSPAGRMDLRTGKSHASLVDVTSGIDNTRKLVVPGDPAASYLLLMVRAIAPADASPPAVAPPASIGYMPQSSGNQTLCCQKLDVLERWIAAGAPSN